MDVGKFPKKIFPWPYNTIATNVKKNKEHLVVLIYYALEFFRN
jgi:hypothetical protein